MRCNTGAVAKILDLEDGALKEQRYYPFDLVH
ncbi:PoNe immunity protein domain-containing protein [Mediterraneibacter gnavus]